MVDGGWEKLCLNLYRHRDWYPSWAGSDITTAMLNARGDRDALYRLMESSWSQNADEYQIWECDVDWSGSYIEYKYNIKLWSMRGKSSVAPIEIEVEWIANIITDRLDGKRVIQWLCYVDTEARDEYAEEFQWVKEINPNVLITIK